MQHTQPQEQEPRVLLPGQLTRLAGCGDQTEMHSWLPSFGKIQRGLLATSFYVRRMATDNEFSQITTGQNMELVDSALLVGFLLGRPASPT
jgi:hypothetical protein